VDLSIAIHSWAAPAVGSTLTTDTKLSRTAGRWAVSSGANVSAAVVLKSLAGGHGSKSDVAGRWCR
jgi:hypothetical protein